MTIAPHNGREPVAELHAPVSVPDLLGSVLAQVREAIETTEAARAAVAAQLDAIDTDLGRMRAVLSAAEAKPARKVSSRKGITMPPRVGTPRAGDWRTTSTGHGVSLGLALEGAEVIKRLVAERTEAGEPETFTQRDVYRHPELDWDQTRGSAAFRYWRHIGFIRKAGRVQEPGSTAELWALMDADAIDRAVAEAKAAQQAGQHPGLALNDERLQAALDYIEHEGEVKGWRTVAQAVGVGQGSEQRLREAVAATGKVDVVTKRGTSAKITWKGDGAAGA